MTLLINFQNQQTTFSIEIGGRSGKSEAAKKRRIVRVWGSLFVAPAHPTLHEARNAATALGSRCAWLGEVVQ